MCSEPKQQWSPACNLGSQPEILTHCSWFWVSSQLYTQKPFTIARSIRTPHSVTWPHAGQQSTVLKARLHSPKLSTTHVSTGVSLPPSLPMPLKNSEWGCVHTRQAVSVPLELGLQMAGYKPPDEGRTALGSSLRTGPTLVFSPPLLHTGIPSASSETQDGIGWEKKREQGRRLWGKYPQKIFHTKII